MSITSHDGSLGWIHGFKINRNNPILGATAITPAPYAPIIRSPNFHQVLNNWNFADTSLVFVSIIVGSIGSYRLAKLRSNIKLSTGEQKTIFARLLNYSFFLGVILAFRNSAYRLEGLVPNGLPKT